MCNVANGGSGNVNPGLTLAGSPGGVKIQFTTKLMSGSCTGTVLPTGLTVTGGYLTGSGYYNAPTAANGSSCANFDGPDVVGLITVVIHWTTTGGPATTTIKYKLNTATVAGALTDTITLKAPPGIAAKSGSFTAGTPNKTQLVTNLPAPASCSTTPFTLFNITGGVVHM